MQQKKENFYIQISLAILLVFFMLIAILTNGTFDYGDSVMHYLYSRYAFKYPEFFLHHWGKPVFILLSAPLAQLGFAGIKIFNCLIGILTAWFVYLTSRRLEIKLSYVSIIFLFLAPKYFLALYSGLTEPLFGFFLILSIYLFLKEKFILSLVVVSFMPFVRSEGLLIMIVFFIFLIITKRFRFIPFLIAGHVAYAIVGYFYYHDFLWVINKIPYGKSMNYGSGELLHFVEHLPYVLGTPLLVFFVLGLIYILLAVFITKIRNNKLFLEEFFLVYGCFMAYFVAHTIFWWKGTFGSFGLDRVLVAIVPLAAIICLRGLNLLSHNTLFKKKMIRNTIFIIGILIVLFFPFTKNNVAVITAKALKLSDEQQLMNEIGKWYRNSKFTNAQIYYSHPYFALGLDIDPFDQNKLIKMYNVKKPGVAKNNLILWDPWFSVTAHDIPLDYFMNNKEFKLLKVFEKYTPKPWDKKRIYKLYVFQKI